MFMDPVQAVSFQDRQLQIVHAWPQQMQLSKKWTQAVDCPPEMPNICTLPLTEKK